tara:strand:+ start:3409 stop:4608 length:1200 start_codon:yes stop_codon:yes gene_type:complete
MNIAVLINHNLKVGGGFQQPLSVILMLSKRKSSFYNFVFLTTEKENVGFFKELNVDVEYISIKIRIKFLFNFLLKIKKILNKKRQLSKFDEELKKRSIDLVYFLGPYSLWKDTKLCNYIFTLHDLCHRDMMEFPEVRIHNEFERREVDYGNGMKKAIAIIVDSEISKASAIKKYGLDNERISVLPFLPCTAIRISDEEYDRNYIDIAKKYNLNRPYIFYPAQFWSHKNHIYILEGIKLLKDNHNLVVSVVFTGSDFGNQGYIKRKTKEFELSEQIHFLGHVPNSDLVYLYKQALALVMVTYFGPTNLPPLEAFFLKVPVIHSNLPIFQEQIQGRTLQVNLKKPEDLANQILTVLYKRHEIQSLLDNGYDYVNAWGEDEFWDGLKQIFDSYDPLLKTWAS